MSRRYRDPGRWFGDSARLRVLVFVCGACLMAWEIAGSRVLGPDFGSTIYVWGSLIGVIMAALSGGYYLGGILVDRKPSLGVLCAIVALSGIVLLIDRVIAASVCRWVVGAKLGVRLAPLLASVVLFLPASVLLGMVSPFALRLEARSVGTMGNVAGMLYALSTVGSIVGTLVTSFYLLETFRVTTIILMLGGLLIVAALYLWLPRYVVRAEGLSISLIVAVVALVASPFVPASGFSIPLDIGYTNPSKIVAELESAYQHIIVLDREGGGRKARELRFDHYIQSAVYLDADFEPATQYTELFYLPFIFKHDIHSVLIIGLGGGVGPRMFAKYKDIEIDCVEIDPKVLVAAEDYFGFKTSDRCRVHIADGRVYIRNMASKYDLIILDAYSVGGRVPFHLLTREFYEEVYAKLNPGGVVLSNIISPLEGPRNRLYRASLKTYNAVFGPHKVYVFRKRYTYEHGADSSPGNTALIAVPLQTRRLTGTAIEQTASRLAAEGLVDSSSFVHNARQFVSTAPETKLDDVPLLTDDYAPVDLMVVPAE